MTRIADHQAAIDQARAWLTTPDAVILDTETTDLDGYLVQIAIVDMQGTPLLNTLINPQAPIRLGAERIHGITAEAVADAPTFAHLAEQLVALLSLRSISAT
jgi:DNA polymerase-3 subunit epsilon